MPKDIPDTSADKSIIINSASTEVVDNPPNLNEKDNASKELAYQKAVNFMKCIKCMKACNDKIEMYLQTAKQFSKLSDYKDAQDLKKSCKRLAKKTKEEINKRIYERAIHGKEEARLSGEYLSAAEEFRKVSGYQDADELAAQCVELSKRIENKAVAKRMISFGAVALLILIIILGITTSFTKYYLAYAYKNFNAYSYAISIYKNLDGYKDSKEKLIEAQYLYGLELKSEGNYKGAVKEFAAAGDFKDSAVQKADAEKLVIKNSKVGKIVRLGNCDWRILDLQNDKALLMIRNALEPRAYHDIPGDITWENSALRTWINTEFIHTTFSQTEQSNIIPTKVVNSNNPTYGTAGGNDTTDKAFLLSMEEVQKYRLAFPEFKSNSWLRSPGNNQRSAAFLSIDGTVMSYGYDTTSKDFTIRPVLWYTIN
jgi:hypothetical protein